MNREERKESSYSWIGKNIHTDKQSHISYYRGVKIQERKNLPEINIFLKEFILIETEEVGQQFVARLKKLYEDGAQEKYATVELFSRIADIPLSQRLSLGQEDSNEIFQNENIEQDTTILVTSIICTVPVIPLSPHELLPVMPKDVQIFFIRKSWDGKKFKPLSPRLLAELKDTVKMKSTDVNFATEYHLTPKHNVCSLEVEPELFIHSARKSQKSTLEVESRHTASKSSLVKQRRSERIAKGNHTPGAKKKLQLNNIKLLEDHSDEMDTSLSSPCQRNQESSRKTRRSALKNTTIDSSDTVKQNEICKIANGLKDSKKQLTILHSNSKNQQSLGEEEVLTIGSLAETPRSRRKCAQITATRIAEQLGVLGTALVKGKEEDFLSPSGSSESSNSEDEKEVTMPVRPKRLTKSTRRSLRKPSGEKTPRDSCKTPEPRTPKTPRNAIPRIRNRNQTVQKPASVLEEARMRLHVSAVPESLPCREKEFQDIYNFIESKLINETGGCMYISGVPGTGKTATVHEAIHYLQQAVENNELPSFQFIEINGMKLTDPHQAYVQILKLLTGQKATANHAAELLEKMFCKPSSKRKTIVLVVDELDLLWTRKQNVMYNLFDWPTKKNAKLIVLAIANTMDLPERIMMNRVASRLGLTRMSFQPYTFKQLQTIISSRMNDLKAFEEEAIEFVSRKVAALSGDARRCLDICRRSTEICELADQKSDSGLVSITHVMKATDEMFSSPYINTIRNASLQEQIFLKATIAEFHRLGLEEATVHQVFHQHVALCRIEGLQTPTISEIMAIASRLSACRLLLAESSHKYLHMRIRLNVSQDDVMYALKKEE
uniref:Origin recognition complex subunit 1 n=1 Tax=Pogona vitticeps TaxID=103695 RepID=A0ABM5G7T9_9SAUR